MADEPISRRNGEREENEKQRAFPPALLLELHD
jgi:hypothetical protein